MAPRFDDLFAFGTSVCYLRVYDGAGGESIALAVHLEDSPGPSVFNAAEVLMERIAAVFAGPCRLFVIFPEIGETWTEVHGGASQRDATFHADVPHAEVQRLAGEAVGMPPAEECTAAGLGGSRHPLLALIPAEEEPVGPFDGMDIVAVADLPWAHNPFRCAHRARFEAIRGHYDKDFDGHIPAGAHFFLHLDAEQLAACPYHQHDWVAIADASIVLLEGLTPASERRDVFSAAAELLPDGPDREQLVCLFTDPIVWSPGHTSITNGQHRACALKASGATLCAALIGGERRYEAAVGDARRRAQSDLAAYWVEELGRKRAARP